MKCTNRNRKAKLNILSVICVLCLLLCGCGGQAYDMPYNCDSDISGFNIIDRQNSKTAGTFAGDLCVVTDNVTQGTDVDMTEAYAAGLFNLNTADTIYAYNVHTRLHPASLTKVMTALVALKYGSPDQTLKATDAVVITEKGAQLCGLKPGESMTLNQALHILLLYSANDVAMLIAENIGGSVEGFVNLMNAEAKNIGATNTHFVNPHGLTNEEHYTTAYDLYLIFNEAIKYDKFNEIIQMSAYDTTYYDSNGNLKEISVKSTNLYVRGDRPMPENITVLGGKTGTTNAARHCLILLSRDTSSNPYISVVLGSSSTDNLYLEMTDLLTEITK